jgi:hypothetical protein
MKVGIVGYARSGKTTIFNALTGSKAAVGAFGSRDANVAVIKVPDERVDRLAEFHQPKKITYAEVEFVDIAPNEAAGADKALDSAALTVLKNVDALAHVVRAFENDGVLHPNGGVNPARDCRSMEEELQFCDLIIIEKRIERLEKENRKDSEYALLKRCQEQVEAGKPLRTLELSSHEEPLIAGYCFLSQKPMLILGNYGEASIGKDDPSGLAACAAELGLALFDLCGEMEIEVAELPEEERAAFREELGLGEESRTRFLQKAYDTLGLMSFLTAGTPEVRAWTIRKGTRAVDAAGVIHSDIKRGFIRAEVVQYDHFIAAGSMAKVKEHGHMRLEGKEYIVQDGDILLFRFNV